MVVLLISDCTLTNNITFWSDAFSGTLELYRAVSEVGCGSTNIGQLSESPNHKP